MCLRTRLSLFNLACTPLCGSICLSIPFDFFFYPTHRFFHHVFIFSWFFRLLFDDSFSLGAQNEAHLRSLLLLFFLFGMEGHFSSSLERLFVNLTSWNIRPISGIPPKTGTHENFIRFVESPTIPVCLSIRLAESSNVKKKKKEKFQIIAMIESESPNVPTCPSSVFL